MLGLCVKNVIGQFLSMIRSLKDRGLGNLGFVSN